MKIDEIRTLKNAGQTLATLRPSYLKEIQDSSCDKHDMKFGGDSRFSVFQCTIFLDCHTGYYGNSSGYTKGSVDSKLATTLLNYALNKHMDLILNTMAEAAMNKAAGLTAEAEKEIQTMQALIDSVKAESQQNALPGPSEC
jgi:hypothetical protein